MNSTVRLPPPVLPGARVGVAALSGPVDPDRLRRGLDELARLGFEPVPAANLASHRGLFAGADGERLAAFHDLAADPTVEAILFARGGHGVLRLLDRIDWDLLARHPRAYAGYSDLTPFLLSVVERLGLAAFHGPMVAADLARGLTAGEEASFLGALAGSFPAAQPFSRMLRPGQAVGPLLGGCLSLLAATLGTPYFPDLQGAILFWEDVNEPPYRIDRMLAQLRLAGRLDGIAGMVVGHLDGAEGAAFGREAWAELVEEAVAGFSWPVAFGHNSGHRSPNWTLPLGLPARLDGETGRLVLGEP